MKLIVALGNPGTKYQVTRHNAGFILLDHLARKHKIEWAKSKFDGDLGRGIVLGEECLLLKPMTYMNLSGRSVGPLARFFKLEEDDVVVIHDDIDVPSGKVKAKLGGSDGGHNGIKSIMSETGMHNFHRIKLGVGRPEGETRDWVLDRLSEEELKALETTMYDDAMQRIDNVFKHSRAKRSAIID